MDTCTLLPHTTPIKPHPEGRCRPAVPASSPSRLWLFATPRTAVRQAPVSMGILQASILEWAVMPSSRGSSQPRGQTQVSHTAGGFFTSWATRGALVSGKLQRLSQVPSFLVSYQFSKFLPTSCLISRRYHLIPQRIKQSSHSQGSRMTPESDLLSSFHRLTSLNSLVPENLKTDKFQTRKISSFKANRQVRTLSYNGKWFLLDFCWGKNDRMVRLMVK